MKIVQSLLDCIEYINGIISDFKEFLSFKPGIL